MEDELMKTGNHLAPQCDRLKHRSNYRGKFGHGKGSR